MCRFTFHVALSLFQEWRHAHGMRCLGIPNTAHFANVTQIEDAVSLWAKLKLQKASERWQPDTEEEYEDSSGNVVNKKTYEDLKRQGLLQCSGMQFSFWAFPGRPMIFFYFSQPNAPKNFVIQSYSLTCILQKYRHAGRLWG